MPRHFNNDVTDTHQLAPATPVPKTYQQRFPESATKLGNKAKDRDLLGFHDTPFGNEPNSRLRMFTLEHLSTILPERRRQFDRFKVHLYGHSDAVTADMERPRQPLLRRIPEPPLLAETATLKSIRPPSYSWRSDPPMTRPSTPTPAPDVFVPEQRPFQLNARACVPGVRDKNRHITRQSINSLPRNRAAVPAWLPCKSFADSEKSSETGSQRAGSSARPEGPHTAPFLPGQSGSLSAGTGWRNDAICADVTRVLFYSCFKCACFSVHGGRHAA